jgi:four helix bundle protein
MPQFTQLRVWKEAFELSLRVYRATRQFPDEERYGLTSQMRRAATSVGANVAEGQKRGTDKDFRSFVVIAEGSLAELQHFCLLSRELGYLAGTDYDAVWAQSVEVEKMLQGLRTRLSKS